MIFLDFENGFLPTYLPLWNIVLKITDLKILMVQQNSSIHFKVPKIYDFDQIR